MSLVQFSIAVAVLVAACGGAQSSRAPRSQPGAGTSYSSHGEREAFEGHAVEFRGSCSFARPPGALASYNLRVRVLKLPLGTIVVRRTASFPLEDRATVMGEVASGTVLLASGPVAGGGDAHGVGYAVLLRDLNGQVCRGYVSQRVVEVVATSGR